MPLAPRPRPAPTAVTPSPQPQVDPREQRIKQSIAYNSQVLAVTNALVKVLAVRAYLFFALIGAFVLGLIALDKGTWIALSILGAYCCLTVIPLCWLDVKTRQGAQ